jgi:hypothetical protein
MTKIDRRRFLRNGSSAAIGGALLTCLPQEAYGGVDGQYQFVEFAIIDDCKFGGIAVSRDGTRIAACGHDFTSARIYTAQYPPETLKDYRRAHEIQNATYGVSAMAWSDDGRLAFVVQETKTKKLPPHVVDRDQCKSLIADANLKREDYQFVLYVMKADGSDLRKVHVFEGGPINGRTKKGNIIELAWPDSNTPERLYCFMEGRIREIDIDSGHAKDFWLGTPGWRVSGVCFAASGCIASWEYMDVRKPPAIVFLDLDGKVVHRHETATPISELIEFPIYGGGRTYVDRRMTNRVLVTRVMALQSQDSVASFPDPDDGWFFRPRAIVRNDKEIVYLAAKTNTHTAAESGHVPAKRSGGIAVAHRLLRVRLV